MSKSTDTDRVLRMLRQLMETKRETPRKHLEGQWGPNESPEYIQTSIRYYERGRQEAYGEIIGAITEALGEESTTKRYTVVGALTGHSYTGTMETSSLRLIGYYDDIDEVRRVLAEQWDDNGGLMLVLDNENESEEGAGEASR